MRLHNRAFVLSLFRKVFCALCVKKVGQRLKIEHATHMAAFDCAARHAIDHTRTGILGKGKPTGIFNHANSFCSIVSHARHNQPD